MLIHGFFSALKHSAAFGLVKLCVFLCLNYIDGYHSKNIEESDRNFGNNLIIWDLVFGTYFNPKNREVDDIGFAQYRLPKRISGANLKAPFAKRDISKPEGYVK